MNEERLAALKSTTDKIVSKYGNGAIMKFGEADTDLTVEAIPTGALALDGALGIGGVPRGRIVEIFGPESSGKTTLALQILAEAQALGGAVGFRLQILGVNDPAVGQLHLQPSAAPLGGGGEETLLAFCIIYINVHAVAALGTAHTAILLEINGQHAIPINPGR